MELLCKVWLPGRQGVGVDTQSLEGPVFCFKDNGKLGFKQGKHSLGLHKGQTTVACRKDVYGPTVGDRGSDQGDGRGMEESGQIQVIFGR